MSEVTLTLADTEHGDQRAEPQPPLVDDESSRSGGCHGAAGRASPLTDVLASSQLKVLDG